VREFIDVIFFKYLLQKCGSYIQQPALANFIMSIISSA